MLSRTRETQMEKAKNRLRDVITHAENVVRDERLRADIRAAAAHGAKAGEHVKKDVDAGGRPMRRLAEDKKLRRNLRAMLDDLDHASDRLRRKRGHRVRNIIAGVILAVVTLALLPRLRIWVSEPKSQGAGAGGSQAAPLM